MQEVLHICIHDRTDVHEGCDIKVMSHDIVTHNISGDQ